MQSLPSSSAGHSWPGAPQQEQHSQGPAGSQCPEAPQGAHRGCPRCHSLSPGVRISQLECAAALEVLEEPPRECISLTLSLGAAGAVGSQAPSARSKPGTHILCSLSVSWRRKPKLSKISAMCSKSEHDSVISCEGRRAVLATIPVSPKLMGMDLFSAYLFCGCLFHDISSIS